MESTVTPPSQLPVCVPAQKEHTTFGSLVVAMLIGAFITVTLLYMWGAQIAKDQRTTTEQR